MNHLENKVYFLTEDKYLGAKILSKVNYEAIQCYLTSLTSIIIIYIEKVKT